MADDDAPLTSPIADRRLPRPLRQAAAALACGAAVLLAAAPAHAQWKWRDASGVMHFSDRPPPASVPDKDILQRPSGARTAATAVAPAPAIEASPPPAATAAATRTSDAPRAKSTLEQQLEARRKVEDQERAAKARADEERQAAARADNCKRARSALATLDSGQRLVRLNEKGEREFVDERQRADEARRAREVIASDCR